jgi:hypothetical protein
VAVGIIIENPLLLRPCGVDCWSAASALGFSGTAPFTDSRNANALFETSLRVYDLLCPMQHHCLSFQFRQAVTVQTAMLKWQIHIVLQWLIYSSEVMLAAHSTISWDGPVSED